MKDTNKTIRQTLMNQASKYIAPIFVADHRKTRYLSKQGTAFFYENHGHSYIITANHVYEALMKELNDSSTCLYIKDGTPKNNIFENLVLSEPNIDIAIFEISQNDIPSGIHICTASLSSMPQRNNTLLTAGYPGVEKTRSGNNINFGIYTAMPIVNHVSNNSTFNFHIGPDNLIDDFDRGLPKQGYNIGGMSGSPVFRITQVETEQYQLCGVLTDSVFKHSVITCQYIGNLFDSIET